MSPPENIAEPKSVRAARWLKSAQDRFDCHGVRPSRFISKKAKRPSVRDAAKLFKTGKTQISLHLKALRDTKAPAISQRGVGRPTSLTPEEDDALEIYANWLVRSGSLCAKDLLEGAANLLRARRSPPVGPVCEKWYSRWKENHPWFQPQKSFKPVDVDRMSAQQQIAFVEEFFEKYEAALIEYNIIPSGCWNADEMGCIMAMLSGKFEILTFKLEKKMKVSYPSNCQKRCLP